MNAEMKDLNESLNILKEMMDVLTKMILSTGGSEDDILDIMERAWVKHYNSSDNSEAMSMTLILALSLGFAWNGMVDKMEDPMLHKDALTKRFLQIIWEEQSHEDRTQPSDRVL